MTDVNILLSKLATEHLKTLSPSVGRAMVQAFTRLTIFPESAPPLLTKDYQNYRQLLVKNQRAIYRYFPQEKTVRVYCILHTRRRLPSVEFLIHQLFFD